MSTSRPLPRASPSRLKPSSKIALEPAQIPLPPSPPASGGGLISDPFAPHPSSSPQRPRRTCTRTKSSSAANPASRDKQRVFEAFDGLQLPFNPTSARTRPKRPRVVHEQFDSSSPPTSPTNRKSTRSSKRLKLASSSPCRRSHRLPAKPEHRDSPNNPFLAKPGEKPRRADSRRNDGQRQLIYVFRGKRIPCGATEDLDETGGSPFNLSGPKLLFPSPPSPAPAPKLKFRLEEPAAQGDSLLTSPQRRNQDRIHLAFQTPKRDKTKSSLAPPAMLPTPQSRPRRTQRGPPNPPTQPLSGVVKSSRTMAKAMR